jgi:large subunit ribosomal protein L18
VRSKIIGKTDLLRLSVYRSNQYIYAQAIDDTKKITVASQSGKSIEGKTNKSDAE